MRRRTTLAASLIVSVVCTFALYAYAWSINPRVLAIGDIGYDDVGAMVRTEGRVRTVESLGSGGLKAELLDQMDFASISVFISGKASGRITFRSEIVPGAMLRVAGEVQEFRGMLEIAVSDPSLVELLSPASMNRLDLGTLALNPEVFSGMEVLVKGEVEGITAVVDRSKVMLSAEGETLWVENLKGGQPRGSVDVFGVVLYNVGRGRFEIKVAGEGDGVAPHPSPVPPNYTLISVVSLARHPEKWEGSRIALVDVIAMAGEAIGTTFSLTDSAGGGSYSLQCIVFGWDWQTDRRGIEEGSAVEFTGIWGYYAEQAQWQVTSDTFSLRT